MNNDLINEVNIHDISNHEEHPWVDGDFVSPQKLHKHIRDDHNFIVVSDGNLGEKLYFFYEDGYYKRFDNDAIIYLVKSHIPEEIRKPSHWNHVLKELKTNKATTHVNALNADYSIINFQNGILDINTGELRSHSPEILSTIQIPFDYRPDLSLSDAPIFSKYLNDLTLGEEELKTVIMEYLGAIISNVKGYDFKKMMIVTGLGNTGKSKILNLASELVGTDNYHAIKISDLNARFGTSQIYGKRLIGYAELDVSGLHDVDTLKALTGGDVINAEYKGKDAFSFIYNGLILYVCNDMPSFKGDQGDHVYERIIMIPCKNIIPLEKREPKLLEMMLNEKEAIVSAAVRYMQNAVRNKYKFSEGEIILSARNNYQYINNSLQQFIEENCNLSGMIRRSTFNRAYPDWCRRNGIKNIIQQQDIAPFLDTKYKITAIRKNGEYWYPITLKNF